ncbi:MAG: hypothetical protein FJ317_03415 [SAR202 cluster bacterium]|nr:hypothetical protein [SAR202 cluster bacterium]
MFVHLKAEANTNYMVTEGAGGGAVNVNRGMAGPWELLLLVSSGGSILDASQLTNNMDVGIAAFNGKYLRRDFPSGSVTADADNVFIPGALWKLRKVAGSSGSAIRHGDMVAFRTGGARPFRYPFQYRWMQAVNGGGDRAGISGWMSNPQGWEKF